MTSAPTVAPEGSAAELSQGLLGAAIAVTAWSTGTILAKAIDMPALSLGVYRFGIFSILITIFMRARGIPLRREILRYSALGGIALGLDIAFFFSAVRLTTVVNATLIGSLQPILVGVVAAVFFGETIRRTDAMWSLLALAGVIGVILASGESPEWSIKGDLLSLAAMFMWGGYFIFSKQSKKHLSPTEYTAGTTIWSVVILLPLSIAFGQDLSPPSADAWVQLAAMLVVSGVIGHVLMNWSLVRIPLWVGSTFTLFIPVAAALMAWVFLDEPLTWMQAIPVAVVIFALAAIVRGQSADSTATEDEARDQIVPDDAIEILGDLP